MTGHTDSKRSIDMLNGPLWNKILLFALPLAATSMLQQLFNATDVAVVGQFVGKHAMAAVGSNAPLISLTINLFVGISIGSNVVIAKFTGQKRYNSVNDAVHTSIMIAVLGGLILTALGEIFTVPALHILSVPEEIFDLSKLYLRIYFTGMPFILLYNFQSAIFRSQGDTRTPLLCLITGGITNVGLNLFFVIILGMKVEGVAIATITANIISSGMLFWFLTHHSGIIRVEIKKIRIHAYVFKTISSIGIPSGIQGMVFSISNIVLQSAVNSLGPDVIAGTSSSFNIDIMVFFLLNAFGQACVSFTSQNYGAQNYDRCRRVFKVSFGLQILFTVAVSMLILLFSRPLLSIFNNDPAVLEVGTIRITYIMTTEVLNAAVEMFSSALRGLGHSMKPAIISMIGICGVRISWVYTVFAGNRTISCLMLAYPISWAVTTAVLCIVYFATIKKVLPKSRTDD